MYHNQKILADPIRNDGHDANGRPGDCWKACVASLLGVEDYDSVPHFVELDNWWAETYQYIWKQSRKSLNHWRDPKYAPSYLQLFIGAGPSPRGPFHHAVLVDREGKLVHDPHPSRAGLLQVEDYYGLI